MFQGLAYLGLALLAAAPVLASGRAADRIVGVDPREPATLITTAFLLGSEFPPGATIVGNTGVQRGTLTRDPVSGDFSYVPAGDFWTLGTERFTYTARHPSTGETSIGVVMLVGLTAAVFDSLEDFDDPTMNGSPWGVEEIEGSATVANDRLTILGTVVVPNEAEANAHRAHFANAVRGLAQGGKANGTGGSPPPQPPPGGGGAAIELPWSFTLMRGAPFNAGGESPFWVDLRPAVNGDDVRLAWRDQLGAVQYGDWVWVGSSPHEYELNWWETNDPKIMLWVDHRLVVEQAVDANVATVDRFEMGVLSPHPVIGSGLQIDDLSLYSWGTSQAEDRPTERVTVQLVESLEDGSAAPLGLVGPVVVSATSPLNGTHDLRFEAQGETAKVVLDPIGSSLDGSWNARFRFRADGLQIPSTTIVTIAEGFTLNRASFPFKVQVRSTDASGYQIRVLALKNGLGAPVYAEGPWGHLSGLGTNIEIQWWTSRSEGFDTGGARVWVNNAVRSEVKNVANRGQTVSGFQLGLIAPSSTVTGHARMDTIQTWINAK